ncbi:hypothetical protein Tco_0825309 [Tanacetum coccineum]
MFALEKTSESKKPERLIPKGHRVSHRKTTTVPTKTRSPKSCLRWQPTGRILKTVCLRWVPTGRLFNSCTSKVESEPTHGSNVDIYHIHACKQTLGLSAADQASIFMEMMSVHISAGLVLHQMTSDHNRSDLGIQDHRNEQSTMLRTTGIMPTKIELTLEQSQQGVSNDVLVHKLLTKSLRNIIVDICQNIQSDTASVFNNDEWKSFQFHQPNSTGDKIYFFQNHKIRNLLKIKLPILQPVEYDLWKMRMEQYLQCIDYTLWEIIENGNAPIVTKTVDGKETVIPPTSVEEKAQRRA